MDKIKQLRNYILLLYSESIIFFLVFYAMMMPQRFKQIEGIVIDGITRSHELYVYAFLIIVKVVIDIFYKRIRLDKVLWVLVGLSVSYMILSTIFKGIHPQSLYALFTMIVPTSMLLILDFKHHQSKHLFFLFYWVYDNFL